MHNQHGPVRFLALLLLTILLVTACSGETGNQEVPGTQRIANSDNTSPRSKPAYTPVQKGSRQPQTKPPTYQPPSPPASQSNQSPQPSDPSGPSTTESVFGTDLTGCSNKVTKFDAPPVALAQIVHIEPMGKMGGISGHITYRPSIHSSNLDRSQINTRPGNRRWLSRKYHPDA